MVDGKSDCLARELKDLIFSLDNTIVEGDISLRHGRCGNALLEGSYRMVVLIHGIPFVLMLSWMSRLQMVPRYLNLFRV